MEIKLFMQESSAIHVNLSQSLVFDTNVLSAQTLIFALPVKIKEFIHITLSLRLRSQLESTSSNLSDQMKGSQLKASLLSHLWIRKLNLTMKVEVDMVTTVEEASAKTLVVQV